MKNNMQQIACPVCQTPVYFNTEQLLNGQNFSCSGCDGVIGLAATSKKVVEDTMDKFDQLKKASINK